MDQVLPRGEQLAMTDFLAIPLFGGCAVFSGSCCKKSLSSLPTLSITDSCLVSKKFRMDGNISQKDENRECCIKGACEYKPRKPVSDDIILHILNLYGSCATPRDFEIYAPNASFEDPLMCAHGVKQIKSAFYSISKVFSESRIVEYNVEQKAKSAGKQEILINSKQHYKFLGRNIDLISLIKLYVEDGKVVRHEDWWHKKPIGNRETIKFPLVGHLMERLRRGSMLATHSLMGFGKDPST